MSENRKIKGTQTVNFEDIHFKSKLEKSCYIKLKELGFAVSYEPERINIWEGNRSIKDNPIAYQPSKKNRKEVEVITRPLLPITYTPDFLVVVDSTYFYFDAKGYANDRYPIKKKMFINYLMILNMNNTNKKYYFFEVKSVTQLLHATQIIKQICRHS